MPTPNQTVDIKDLIAQAAAKGITVTGVPQPRALSVKLAAKGGVSVYGINVQFPVTLYREQWERLIPFLGSAEFKAALAKAPTKAENRLKAAI